MENGLTSPPLGRPRPRQESRKLQRQHVLLRHLPPPRAAESSLHALQEMPQGLRVRHQPVYAGGGGGRQRAGREDDRGGGGGGRDAGRQ